ncbi:MAG: membrane protein insertion efficiency factor YidD [Chitinophagales bacterium]
MAKLLVKIIKVYRFLTVLKKPSCRYIPSCSTYALQAVEKYGAWKGSLLALKRVSRCHPFHPGGYDPVP